MEKIGSVEELDTWRKSLQNEQNPSEISVAICGTGCAALGSQSVIDAFNDAVDTMGLKETVRIIKTGCHGFCEAGPVVVILPKRIFYAKVKPEDAQEIIEKTVQKGEIIDRLCYTNPESGEKIVHEHEVPFYAKQERMVLDGTGRLDPTDIHDYITRDGYGAISKVLTAMTPDTALALIEKSNLRGRGGAGFPTGRKWRFARNASGEMKYIVCNGDEGDPGAFMDRGILEGNPHLVLEGMMIAAYAIGASVGYIYVRAEYPIAIVHLKKAIAQAQELGLLGENILDSGFNLELRIKEGAGAFVCGEETALMASIEGRIGRPRPRPPFPVQSGLWGKPTCINNVETFANVPRIIQNGSDWFANMGTESTKGTKIFALTGKVNNTGLVEVPMGATLREVIYDIGGGILQGKKFKAAQTGGPSGGCIPEKYLDLPIDYESLASIGSIMGSGGLVVMDESTCMVDVARFFLSFTQSESCGKCTPCRLGTKRMLEILTRITEGKGVPEDLDLLTELGEEIQDTALCGLGQTAPNPVLSTLQYFRDEYEAHIRDHRCPAAVCKALIQYSINDNCTGCRACVKACPEGAISGEKKEKHTLDSSKCIQCGICFSVCRHEAIEVH